MFKKLLFTFVVVLSIITFSNLVWASVVGTWEMTGKVTTTIKAKGMKSKTLKGTLDGDSWTFNGDNSFESDNIGGTWSQKKTKVTVNLDTDDIISFFEEMLSEELETDISVDAITKNTCTATENVKKKTIKGSLKIYMNISGYDEDCDCERTGKVTVSGRYTGTPTIVAVVSNPPPGANTGIKVYVDGVSPSLYALYGGNVVPTDVWAIQERPEDYGFILLGKANITEEYSGEYYYYLLKPAEANKPVSIDALQLLASGQYYSGSFYALEHYCGTPSSNDYDMENLNGPPDGKSAQLRLGKFGNTYYPQSFFFFPGSGWYSE